jgi:hypothetical protein
VRHLLNQIAYGSRSCRILLISKLDLDLQRPKELEILSVSRGWRNVSSRAYCRFWTIYLSIRWAVEELSDSDEFPSYV